MPCFLFVRVWCDPCFLFVRVPIDALFSVCKGSE